MVEVFKTNVQEVDCASKIIHKLLKHFPKHIINFDLEDCDKVLRMDDDIVDPMHVVALLRKEGCICEILD